METHFSKEQLKDKNNKSSEKIIRKCVHCGFCNATCPTYQLAQHISCSEMSWMDLEVEFI